MSALIPKIHLGARSLSDFDSAIRKEWIVTNGLGGYASSTALGINTRKYHGLLIASFNPPTNRQVLLSKLDEEIQVKNEVYSTGANEFEQHVYPKGYNLLLDFSISPFPKYRYGAEAVQLRKKIFMLHEKNVTAVNYEVSNQQSYGAVIRILPLVNCRSLYSVTKKEDLDWFFIQNVFDRGVTVKPSIPLSTLLLCSSDGEYTAEKGEWISNVLFRVDRSRGDSCFNDDYRPGFFKIQVAPKEIKKFQVLAIAGKDEKEVQNIFLSIKRNNLKGFEALYNLELRRRRNLIRGFKKEHPDTPMNDWLKWIVLAAESFLVKRESTKTTTVIAGYHWFEDWGRDSMIALPGLTLVTGRFEDARKILSTYKKYCRKGLIPNIIADEPVYNTVDASLWFFDAVFQYLKYTNDLDFLKKELWDTLQSIVENYVYGTSYGIHMDDDGLIVHGPQLTWMDTIVEDKPVTPREGKAVEVQALWYNALRIMGKLAKVFGQFEREKEYRLLAEKVRKSFLHKFWNPRRGCLLDVVSDVKADFSLRPNQIIAVALDFQMIEMERRKKIVDTILTELWGTYGLKTLSAEDSSYIGKYKGSWKRRDRAYHNGTVWAWLLGPFIRGFLKTKNYEESWRKFAFESFLKPLFSIEIFQGGLGTISEIFDGDQPHEPRGCISQAWSVAEPLRTYVEDVLMKRPPYERLFN
jgi:predicted glycogen debranching enzyme